MIDTPVFVATILAVLSAGILFGLILGQQIKNSDELDVCSKQNAGRNCVMIAIPELKQHIYESTPK